MSEKDDIAIAISAYMTDFKIGTYQVYDCKSASQCDENMPDNNQIALFQPYPKDPLPSISLSRIAYFAPQLELKPLSLTITSLTDEQQLGIPYKTKRIKGQLNGSLAYIEQTKGTYDWYIVGKTTKIEGNFDMFCIIN